MLKEVEDCRQVRGEPRRRWFTDADVDLIVWFAADDEICGFQLCYNKRQSERALTWLANQGFTHKAVDTGQMYGLTAGRLTPVLVPDGVVNAQLICKTLVVKAADVDTDIVRTVLDRIADGYSLAR